MSQRLDDVTGDPIRLSSAQRERQREAMIDQINQQTRAINTLTKALNLQTNAIADLRAYVAAPETDYKGHIAWHRQPFWRRWFTR